MSKLPDLIRRQRAVDKTMSRFRGRPFKWGSFDCVAMLRAHLLAMGHRDVPKLPKYKDALTARRALKAAGFDSIPDLLDSLLNRIPAAFQLPGDIVVVSGEGGLDAVQVSLGHKALGWVEGHDVAEVLIDREIVGVWRAWPKR